MVQRNTLFLIGLSLLSLKIAASHVPANIRTEAQDDQLRLTNDLMKFQKLLQERQFGQDLPKMLEEIKEIEKEKVRVRIELRERAIEILQKAIDRADDELSKSEVAVEIACSQRSKLKKS